MKYQDIKGVHQYHGRPIALIPVGYGTIEIEFFNTFGRHASQYSTPVPPDTKCIGVLPVDDHRFYFVLSHPSFDTCHPDNRADIRHTHIRTLDVVAVEPKRTAYTGPR